MKLEKYSLYQQSGINWLPEIPSSWSKCRIKDLGILQSGDFISREEFNDEGKYPVYGGNGLRGYTDGYNTDGNYILIGRQGALCGNINYASGKFWATEHAVVLYENKGVNIIWLGEVLRAMNLNQYSLSAAQPGLSVEKIKRLELPFLEDAKKQTQIAQYLNNKTQVIDRKIGLLKEKISKYEELKESLINETVCRGLDKTVKLKDSGIEWIGKIPEHWELKRIKDLYNISRGRAIGQTELIENGKYPVYSSQTENNGCLGYIDSFDYDTTLITWTTDGVNAGTVFKREGKFNCTNICGTLIPNNKDLYIDYNVFAIQESTKHNKRIDTNGAKIMSNEMAVINIVVPPLKEQIEIGEFLSSKLNEINKIKTNLNTQINRLKELRKTLINDVVTGKIKVTD